MESSNLIRYGIVTGLIKQGRGLNLLEITGAEIRAAFASISILLIYTLKRALKYVNIQ